MATTEAALPCILTSNYKCDTSMTERQRCPPARGPKRGSPVQIRRCPATVTLARVGPLRFEVKAGFDDRILIRLDRPSQPDHLPLPQPDTFRGEGEQILAAAPLFYVRSLMFERR